MRIAKQEERKDELIGSGGDPNKKRGESWRSSNGSQDREMRAPGIATI